MNDVDMRFEDLNDYQRLAMRTAKYRKDLGLYYAGLELASEAGECAGIAKKVMRDHDGVLSDEMRQRMVKEAGDALWGLAAIANEIGVPLGTIARLNIEKLADRAERGVISGSGDNR